MQNQNNLPPARRFFRIFLLTVGLIIIFAYGFQVTKINLEEPKQANRQSQLVNVLRALARPDLLAYETERLQIDAPVFIPCPATAANLPPATPSAPGGPSISLPAPCAEPGSAMAVAGTGFNPADEVFLYFLPYKADASQQVELPLTNKIVRPEADGTFKYEVMLKKDRTSEFPQTVRAVVNRTSGWPQPSDTVYNTFDKIIETIFLALIATTLGTVLSIPISFLAARNLMIQVTSLFGSLVTLVVAAPIGWVLGSWLFGAVGGAGVALLVHTGAATGSAAAMWAVALLGLSVQAKGFSPADGWAGKLRHYGLGVLVALGVALALGLVSGLGQIAGLWLTSALGPFGFLGNFLYVVADSVAIFLPVVGGVVGLFAATSLAGSLSEHMLRHTGHTPWGKIYSVVMAALAGAILVGLVSAFIAWLYQLDNPWADVGLPALIAGGVAGGLALLVKVDRPMPTGLMIYFGTRTVLNVLRAIEPLIMAIVFVVWVGIGPFAGVLALTLHTIAALGKLYSEQVENIAQGPLEAVTATGANRLQTIIYAVIPQIVPPYIAFTIYRWDINVRMSTIIGFAGGGGIGFLLQQNLNLLKYRQAAVQMIAIAIVVASLDYVSAKIREKII